MQTLDVLALEFFQSFLINYFLISYDFYVYFRAKLDGISVLVKKISGLKKIRKPLKRAVTYKISFHDFKKIFMDRFQHKIPNLFHILFCRNLFGNFDWKWRSEDPYHPYVCSPEIRLHYTIGRFVIPFIVERCWWY